MRRPVSQHEKPRPSGRGDVTRRAHNGRSRAQRAAAAELDYHAVCLVGTDRPVPREFHDNQGAWPVKVVSTRKPRDAHKRIDLESPLHRVVVLDFVLVESEAHAKRLKAMLDEQLLGTAEANKALRHGWRDIEHDPLIVWPVLLREALERLAAGEADRHGQRMAGPLEVLDEDAAERRIAAHAKRRVR